MQVLRRLLTLNIEFGKTNFSRSRRCFVVAASNTTEESKNGPLSGIRILDLTRILAGPFATMVLSDLGAEVIKVERPGVGDETRNWGPPFVGSESAYFFCVNRNKLSVAVNFRSPDGVKLIHNIAAKCDVLMENFVPGALDKLKLDYESIKKVAPQLIYCSLTGFGPDGPYRHRPGFDVIAASIGGLVSATGPEDGEPAKVGVAMTDIATGLYAHGAIMAALFERQKTGLGQKIDCNLLSTQIACMANLASNYLNGGVETKRRGTAHESIVPYQAFETSDGFITVGGASNLQFVALCQAMKLQNLTEDEKYATNQLRVKHRDSLLPQLAKRFKEKSNADWLEVFDGAKFPYGPINTMSQAFQDPHVVHTGLVKTIEHPTSGEIRLVGPAVQYSQSENSIRRPPPILGQHTREVLTELLGLSTAQVDRLVDDKVIQCAS